MNKEDVEYYLENIESELKTIQSKVNFVLKMTKQVKLRGISMDCIECEKRHQTKINHLAEDIKQMEETIKELNIELSI